ncbi:RNA-directed RNA polymerase L [Golovinomyces cichoracearum]|uniref:RNA-directed RNA polymerase L n=1 Tax=Golovinomyces cichoracearum TaxID=62708 RepID=A0A420J868_9PEZI|nr:RNA-directed RNA polymerase L [Golovinomyces cichoracearum]
MLSRKDISIQKIVDIIESGQMPTDWLTVSLYPKEREFKLAARTFSMMVFETRVYLICLESNLSDMVYPYIRQQTMTQTKNEIIQCYGTLTKPATRDRVHRLFLEIDLSRRNLKWRDLLIRQIGEDLNDMFGMNIAFSMVHEIFKKCLIVVRHNQYPPSGLNISPPPESDLLWYNHEGGFEGIDRTLGQGDNQVILAYISVPPSEEPATYIKQLTVDITREVAKSCELVVQDTIPHECLESTSVITYSNVMVMS